MRYRGWDGDQKANRYSHWVWRRYASSVWDDVRIDRVLPFRDSRDEDDEKHVHPLQLDVIERYLPLKKSGANYFACCPFHGEKSASFSVSPSKQFYHCFGCGVHGSAVGFLMEYSGLGFVDAVKELANQVGLQVPDDGRSATPAHDDASERLYKAMTLAARFYRDQLKPARQAIDYLKRRGLSGQVAARLR